MQRFMSVIVAPLYAWSKPKCLSISCGASITQRQLLNRWKTHSMLFLSPLMIVAIVAAKALVVFIYLCWWWPWVILSWNNSWHWSSQREETRVGQKKKKKKNYKVNNNNVEVKIVKPSKLTCHNLKKSIKSQISSVLYILA